MSESYMYDIEGIINELGIEIASAAELYSKYIEEMRDQSAQMLKLQSDNSWEMLERVIHNIKGVSANLKIDDVYQKSAQFDTLLRQGNTIYSSQFVESIAALIEQSEEKIKKQFKLKGFIIPCLLK